MNPLLKRILWTLAAAIIYCVSIPGHAATLGLDIQNPQFGISTFTNPNKTLGWQFTLSESAFVSGLGVMDTFSTGSSESIDVGLWSQGGSLLASTVIDSSSRIVPSQSTGNRWLFEDVALQLGAGTYVVGSFGSQSYVSDNGFTNVVTASLLSFDGTRGSGTVSSLSFPNQSAGGFAFGPNIEFSESSVIPVPATLPLMLTGLAGLGLIGWRRRRRPTDLAGTAV